ncbi:uncharacterized protein LOC143283098 [Babylonia areolata]|uniref:uncharacterized protein LOC143283098 n=1 Tax=Babylonia areolata TaxID=304850 RepID=UPI003FD36933
MALSWKHVVPWANRAEFVQTYLDLYSKNAERQQRAIQTISLWKCRASNKLSVAIESSASLTQAYLLYQTAVEKGQLRCEDFGLRYAMTLAMIRFVNQVTEKGQNKAFAQPIHKIAEEFGIPEWIVRLRHDGSHGSLPCVDVLTKGVQWALTYLQDVFWSQQVKEADEVDAPRSRKRKRPAKMLYDMTEIRDLLLIYQKASFQSIEDGPDSESAREEKRALRRIEHILNGQQRNNMLRCLVEPGHLLPTEQQLNAYNVNVDETLRADLPRVPDVVISMWKEVLQLVQGKQLTTLLLQHMVTTMVGGTDPSSLHSLTLRAWLRLVLLYHTSNFSRLSEERESQAALYSSAVDFSTDLILATCLQAPSTLTAGLLPLVGDTDSISSNICGKVDKAEDKDHSDDDTEVRGEEETLRKGASSTESKHKLTKAAATEEENLWVLCTEPVDWEWVPIGVLPCEASAAGLGSGGDHRSHGFYSSTDDDEGPTSEDEPDTTTLDLPAQSNRERSPEKLKDDMLRDISIH